MAYEDDIYQQMSLFDFGYNEKGEYVNLVEEEKQKNDIKIADFEKWLANHDDPLVRLSEYAFLTQYRRESEKTIFSEVQNELEEIAKTKCYHYGNMEKGLYIFSLYDKGEDRHILVFENQKHYLLFTNFGFYFNETTKTADFYSLDDVLTSKTSISFPALYCPCFDLNGNQIEEWHDGEEWKKDIRHIVCIEEWQMDKFGVSRFDENKKPRDFYDVIFYMKDLVNYWGEEKKAKNGQRD